MGRKRTHPTGRRVGDVDPSGVANLYGTWDWVGMTPRMEPESCSCTFPLGRPVSRKAGKKQLWWSDKITFSPFPPQARPFASLSLERSADSWLRIFQQTGWKIKFRVSTSEYYRPDSLRFAGRSDSLQSCPTALLGGNTFSTKYKVRSQPRSQSSLATSEVTSPVKLAENASTTALNNL